MSTEVALMTAEEFLALPDDDGIERELIRGELREKPMTVRNKKHTRVAARLTTKLSIWLDSHETASGEIHVGEVGSVLSRDPTSIVGIDVAYFSTAVAQRESCITTLVDGPPILAVEILSPSDQIEDIYAKVEEYLEAGVKVVWIVNPYAKSVEVHRPQQELAVFTASQSIVGDESLPGLQMDVRSLFE